MEWVVSACACESFFFNGLALDVGSAISWVSPELDERIAAGHHECINHCSALLVWLCCDQLLQFSHVLASLQ